jgi:pimeloyl-ACP methyl ester carboxylesterase
MANDIFELINDERSDMIVLMGHSLGGKVAMEFASMYPERLEKLIVADMAPKGYPGNQFPFIEKLLAIDLAEMRSRKEAEVELRKIIKDEATIQLLLKNIQWNEQEKLAWKFNLKVIAENQDKIGRTFSIKENIKVPTLFIRGERSNYILDSDVPQIKKYFPNSEIKDIAGAGHWVHADKPREFADTVKEFLKRV